MASVSRSTAADADLGDIFDYIARDNPEAASGVVRRIAERAQLHANSPLIGTSCPELGQKIRSFVMGNYIAFYLPTDDGILLVRVLHSARDIPKAFFDCLSMV